MAKEIHLHKYKRVNLTINPNKLDYWVFKCIKPNCSHYMREDLVENKMVECNRCESPMIMTRAAMLLVKPHCIDCTKFKKKDEIENVAEFLKKVGL